MNISNSLIGIICFGIEQNQNKIIKIDHSSRVSKVKRQVYCMRVNPALISYFHPLFLIVSSDPEIYKKYSS